MRQLELGRGLRCICGGMVALLIMGCASLPPAKPVTDIQMIAGRWEGTIATRQGSLPGRALINADGSGITEVPTGPGRFEIDYKVANGRVSWHSRTSGRSGMCSLHEDASERILRCQGDDGRSAVDWKPAK